MNTEKFRILTSRNSQLLIRSCTYRKLLKLDQINSTPNLKQINSLTNTGSIIFQSPVTGMSSKDFRSFYSAKCKDLGIFFQQDQFKRFRQFCKQSFKSRKIDLGQAGIGPTMAQELSQFLQLNPPYSSLILRKNRLGDSGIQVLTSHLYYNQILTHLDLASNGISHKNLFQFFVVIARHKTVCSLNLSSVQGLNRNRIGWKGAQHIPILLSSPILTILNLSGTSIGTQGLKFLTEGLKRNFTLLSLDISNNGLGSKLKKFVKTLFYTNIAELNIGLNNISDQGVSYLAQLLLEDYERLPKLMKLNISNNNISQTGGQKVFEALHNNAELRDLNISGNNLGNECGRCIETMLTHNSILNSLNLSGTNLQDSGVCVVIKGISQNQELLTIVLKNNGLTSQTGYALSKMLENQHCIENIDLSVNKISDEGGIIIGVSLHPFCKLKSLNLRQNNLKDATAQCFLQRIRRVNSIESLNLNQNQISTYYLNKIKEQLAANQIFQKKKLTPQIKHNIQKIQAKNKKILEVQRGVQMKQQEKKQAEFKLKKQKIRFQKAVQEQNEKFQDVKISLNQQISYFKQVSRQLQKIEASIMSGNQQHLQETQQNKDKFMFLIRDIKDRTKYSKEQVEQQRKEILGMRRIHLEKKAGKLNLELANAELERQQAEMNLKIAKEQYEKLLKKQSEVNSPKKQVRISMNPPIKPKSINFRKSVR